MFRGFSMRLCGFLGHDFTFSYEIAAFSTKIPRRKAPMIITACCCGMVRRTHQPCTITLCTNVCSAINPENSLARDHAGWVPNVCFGSKADKPSRAKFYRCPLLSEKRRKFAAQRMYALCH